MNPSDCRVEARLPQTESGGIDVHDLAVTTARNIGPLPAISVLIPFYNTSPAKLVQALIEQAAGCSGAVEIVVADDGSADKSLGPEILALLKAHSARGALITPARNVGRARIRNMLAAAAHGEYVLYIDCDMRLGSPRFLSTYLALCHETEREIVYGGFVMAQVDRGLDPLPGYFGRRSDCLPAGRRRENPAKSTLTNNLLVRRAVMLATPFDEGFVGWGWEDVEWALRAAETRTIDHIDNPVINPANGPAAELIEKFGFSAGNFQRLVQRHPVAAARYPIYRASRIAHAIPLTGYMAPLLRSIALDPHRVWPLIVRYYALKLYRACMYRDIFEPASCLQA